MNEDLLSHLQTALPSSCNASIEPGADMPTIRVDRSKLVDLCKALCRDERLEFVHCSGVTAYDDFPQEPRFTAVYFLYSYRLLRRLRIKVSVSENDAKIPSLVDIWPGINCHERETFDMFGIHFENHPNLKRILMPEGYTHYPLRKDFPLEGIEPDRLYREWEQNRNG